MMTEERTALWSGQSGKKYKYCIYPVGTSFNDVPGNYIFVIETGPHTWIPVYIGETDSLHRRLSNPESHEKWPCIRRYGGTHIHIHESSTNETTRRQEEADIIEQESPPCNLED